MKIRDVSARPWAIVVAAFAALLLAPAGAFAQDRTEPLPAELENVGIDEHLDARVPLDAEFTDDLGRTVRLGDAFAAGRPVILTLNYYRCPMLCTLVLNGLVDTLKALEWGPGDGYEIVTVSIDPTETPTLARSKKQSYLEALARPGAESSWRFLTGKRDAIDAVADAVGFRYSYDPDTRQYAHAAAILVLTSDGRVSRYLYGVQYDPKTLRLSLVEASEGRIGTALDRLILYCYHYDPSTGTYAPQALAIMRGGAALTILVLGAVLSTFWIREARRRRVERQESDGHEGSVRA